jgi:hypothetical protein
MWIHEAFAWSYWFIDGGIFIWMLAFFAFFNRAAALYLFTAGGLMGASNEILKVWFSEGRPFYMV